MEESRSKKSFKNIVSGIGNKILTIVLGFLARTIFIQILSVDYLGINSLFTDILSMLSMVDLGFNTAIVFSLYKPLANNDKKNIAALMQFYKNIYNIIAISVAIIGICLVPFLDYIVNVDKAIPNLELYYLLSLANVVISYLFVYKTSILTADQKNYIVLNITSIISTLKTILQIIFLVLFKSYTVYLLLGILSNFICNFWASNKAKKMYPYIQNKEILPKKEKRLIFNNIKSIFIYKVSSLLLTASDNTIISILLGTSIVGYYSNYLMLNTQIVAIITIFFSSLTASIGNLVIKETYERRYLVFESMQSISFILCGIIVTCYAVLVNDFITIWLGKEFVFDNIIVMATALNLYLSCILQPLWVYREATGLYMRTKFIMLLAAIINILLSIILGKIMGLAGILFASAIARLSTYIWYEPKLLFNIFFKRKVGSFYAGILKNFCLVLVIYMGMNQLIGKVHTIDIYSFCLKMACSSVIVSLMFLLVYRKTEGFKLIMQRLKSIKRT
ncbi:lipopolysaccharide biosynthesis protein [Eubacterium maltosivorans]|uniref:Transporter n=1 Tax=Eubacterium maltosivorans TaxID=2041044 RepID=A0A4V1GLL4_EUBML|nr:transporter [Eubacterium maltosivorans]QCT70196.1 transporter [Eubacterium maltosivorans]